MVVRYETPSDRGEPSDGDEVGCEASSAEVGVSTTDEDGVGAGSEGVTDVSTGEELGMGVATETG